MSDCILIEIEKPEIIAEFSISENIIVEIEKEASAIEFQNCETNFVEIPKQLTIGEISIKSNIILESAKKELIAEFPNHVTINNPDPFPPAESSQAVIGTYEAAEQIFTNRVVYMKSDGRVAHADKDAAIDFNDVIGVSKNNAPIGDLIDIVLFGKLSGVNFGVVSATYWLGNFGQLIQAAPLSGVILKIGTQTRTNEMNVKIGKPIRRI